jgi:hypothetical protein
VGYQNFNDTALDLQVRFQKGDGNLGLRDNEPGYNLHVYAMDKQLDGTYIIMRERNSQNLNIWDTVQSFHRFPVFKDANPKAPIKGKLYIPITRGVLNQIRGISQQNIIRFEIYMYDRVPVQSNIVVTPDISIR